MTAPLPKRAARLRRQLHRVAVLVLTLPLRVLTEPTRARLQDSRHEVAILIRPKPEPGKEAGKVMAVDRRPFSPIELKIMDATAGKRLKGIVIAKRVGMPYGRPLKTLLKNLVDAGCLQQPTPRGGYEHSALSDDDIQGAPKR